MHPRKGVTLIEVLLVIAIIAILIGLTIPAIMKVREAGLRIESSNNLRQIAIATHNFATIHRDRLPDLGAHPNGPNPKASLFGALLPFIEQGNVYLNHYRENPHEYYTITTFMSPADPTIASAVAARRKVSSYAANARVFDKYARLPSTFTDGTSNTIIFAEHYAFECGSRKTIFEPFVVSHYVFPSNFFHRATFADHGDVIPETRYNPPPPESTASQPGHTFQVAPRVTDCNPSIPQTPHIGGMLVVIADGSVRALSPGMSEPTFWGAVTPSSGEVHGGDW